MAANSVFNSVKFYTVYVISHSNHSQLICYFGSKSCDNLQESHGAFIALKDRQH